MQLIGSNVELFLKNKQISQSNADIILVENNILLFRFSSTCFVHIFTFFFQPDISVKQISESLGKCIKLTILHITKLLKRAFPTILIEILCIIHCVLMMNEVK